MSLFVLSALIQHDTRVCLFIANKMGRLLRSCGCQFVASGACIDPFLLSITCKKVHVGPLADGSGNIDQSWSWWCDELSVRISWLSLIFLQKIEAVIALKNLVINARVSDEEFPLIDHVKKLFFGINMGIPFTAKILKITQAQLNLMSTHGLLAQLSIDVLSKKVGRQLKSNVYVTDGTVSYKNILCIHALRGTLQSVLMRSGVHRVNIDMRFVSDFGKRPVSCAVQAAVQDAALTAQLCAPEVGITGTAKLTGDYVLNAQIKTESDSLARLGILVPSWLADQITCDVHGTCTKQLSLSATITPQRLPVCAHVQYVADRWSAQIDTTASIGVVGTNYSVQPIKSCIQAQGSFEQAHALFNVPVSDDKKCILCTGKLELDKKSFVGQGQFAHIPWQITGEWAPKLSISFVFQNLGKSPVFFVHAIHDSAGVRFDAKGYYASCATLLPASCARVVRGDGQFYLSGLATDQKIVVDFMLKDATLFLPVMGVLVEDMQGQLQLDYAQSDVSVRDVVVNLHSGVLTCPYARVLLGNQPFIFAPFSFQQCVLAFNGSSGIFSGNLCIFLHANKWKISGLVLSDSVALQTDLESLSGAPVNSFPISLDIKCVALKPVRLKTAQMNTQVTGKVQIGGTLACPYLGGTIVFNGGEILFPFKPMTITHGIVHLVPDLKDALLELTAQTTVGAYAIVLQTTGSISQPHIHLRSMPALTEEQIASLLVSGSTECSINNMVPALIVDRVKNLIIGGGWSALRSLSIAPRFTDDKRYDLCGAVAIDVGEHVQAHIQKGLNFKDDTTFELDYRVIDNVNIKVFKANQGDFGGRVELRLKW